MKKILTGLAVVVAILVLVFVGAGFIWQKTPACRTRY